MSTEVHWPPATLAERKAAFKQAADNDHTMSDKVVTNQFEENWASESVKTKSHKDDPNYGRPVKGSKTEARGIRAHQHMCAEVKTLCEVIRQYGYETNVGHMITFGDLFKIYAAISDKVVGLLLRARKHKMLDFDGEMLFQRRDDNVIITLFKVQAPGNLLMVPMTPIADCSSAENSD